MNYKNIIYISICLTLSSELVFATDLGIYGNVWPIQEIDIKKLLMAQMEKINWAELKRGLIKQTLHWSENLSSINLPEAQLKNTKYFDLSYKLDRDILFMGKIYYQKGELINPIKFIRPVTNMLFFSGNSNEQQDFAIGALKKNPYRLMLVMTEGNPAKFSKLINYPVYFAQPDLLARFYITHVPSLLGIGKSDNSEKIAVTEFSRPYITDQVTQCWNGC